METASKRLRPAQQKRSEISKNKVLESARALFAEKGYSKTRVSDIIKHSGVSTGSFYHRFTDKMGVFLVLLEDYVATSREIIESYDFKKDEYRSLQDAFEEMTRDSCDRLEQSRGFLLAANEISIEQQYVWDQMRDLTKLFCSKASSFVEIYEEEITHEMPEQAIVQAIQLMLSVLVNNEIHPAPFIPKDKDEKIRMLVQAMMGIVQPKNREK